MVTTRQGTGTEGVLGLRYTTSSILGRDGGCQTESDNVFVSEGHGGDEWTMAKATLAFENSFPLLFLYLVLCLLRASERGDLGASGVFLAHICILDR